MSLYATLDTETTGLPDDPDARVIEVGIALIDADGTVVRTYQSFVRPDVLTEAGLKVAWEISGIAPEQIEAAPLPDVVWDEIRAFLNDWAHPVRCWNTPFDMGMVRRTFLSLDEREADELDPIWWNGCAMRDFTDLFEDYAGLREDGTRRFINLRRARSLVNGCGFNLSWEGDAHRASVDAVMTGIIDSLMRRRLIKPKPAEVLPVIDFDDITTMPELPTLDFGSDESESTGDVDASESDACGDDDTTIWFFE